MSEKKNEFEKRIHDVTHDGLQCLDLRTIQINLGLLCNQTCEHCHVNGSPKRTEQMSWPTMQTILSMTETLSPLLIDITGGAPELHPHLEKFLRSLAKQRHRIQLRTNLTILLDPAYKHFISLYKELGIELVASFPCYLEKEVRLQRGKGVFEKSIEALQLLNKIGYGTTPDLPLILVFNPLEPVLPPEQKTLENEYRIYLAEHYKIQFTRLITLTNMPLGRFLNVLKEKKPQYLRLLKESFNPETLPSLMCRHQINIAWDGALYDCDFNLAAGIPVTSAVPRHIQQFKKSAISTRKIATADHCFGCTAGQGSSCGGALV
ncbi:MAG TPA: arsenosugar biosynthesis radical SAM (seleno)protein ArsS [Candidatus Thermoplasmatota archaeon]|nr:arsenosugar biosynthesis radical SAM (seleno)protein ArsS [Candidatus Thermoplasmatota archaeon]